MMALPLEFIAKIMPLFASDKDGEVLSAVHKVTKKLKEAGHDWHDVVKALTGGPVVFGFDPARPTQPAQSPFPWGDMPLDEMMRRAAETIKRDNMDRQRRQTAAEQDTRRREAEENRRKNEAGKVLRAEILRLVPRMMETGFAAHAAEANFMHTLLELAHRDISVWLSPKQAKWWGDIVNRWAAKKEEESHG